MKTALSTFAQFVLFLLVFLVGSFMNPLHMEWFVSHPTAESTRFFVPGGLLLAAAVYVVILMTEMVTRRLRTMGLGTTVGFAFAVVIGLAAKFGWVTR
jgi:hypothetical protein